MTDLDTRRELVVNIAKSYLGDKFWVGKVGNFFKAFTCAHLVLHVFFDAKILSKFPNTDSLFAKAYTDARRGVETPFVDGVNEFFDQKTNEDIVPGDFVLFVYEESFRAHAAIYIGEGKYIDTHPDRGYVAETTLEEMLKVATGYKYHVTYDGLSCKK